MRAGERELSRGNVSGARQFLLRAAATGLAGAALLLGPTYDQHEFSRLRIQGVQPNPSLRARSRSLWLDPLKNALIVPPAHIYLLEQLQNLIACRQDAAQRS